MIQVRCPASDCKDAPSARLTESQRREVERWRRFAAVVACETTSPLPIDDRRQYGALGLIDAVRRADRATGLSPLYVARSVRGAIKEAERFDSHGAVRFKRSGRKPRAWDEMSEPERARLHGVSIEAYLVEGELGQLVRYDPPAPEADAPEFDCDVFATAMDALKPEARYVVHRYFRRGRTLREIGAELGVSESAVSLQLKAALATLRDNQRLREMADLMVRPSKRTGVA